MSDGINAGLDELIALKRYAQTLYPPVSRHALRAGQHLSKLRGRGMDFAEVRHYQPGDEIRHMEWRITARTGKPHVKLYQEERERPVVLFADFSPSMFFGTRRAFKTVIAARLASLLAWTAVKQGDRVGALLVSKEEHREFMPRGRDSGILPLLSTLSRLTFQEIRDYEREPELFRDGLRRLHRVSRPGSLVVLISDFYALNEENEKQLHILKRHNDVLACHICDPMELAPPKPQRYAMSDGRQDLILDTRTAPIYEGYWHYCQQRLDQVQTLLKRAQIQYIQVTADKNLPRLVRQIYPGSGHG